ncbi:hypothetical protein [Campylobacter sp. RM16192]|uniref:hypothetical protein n=1 Tax=Campylobacter sp. RM16192 TaxID=1660080 RepID=UPI00159A0B9E|nr:hypothetical protein [Campylobacter sp. RM16192]QKU36234.1 hypothetical protein CDOMC_a022 [Campylobacter sp. RM16192]
MIDRSYLPYKSAREYIDRGMAKWMGFFISEHSTALSKKDDTANISCIIDEEEKMVLLTEAFLNKKTIILYTTIDKEPFVGTVHDMTNERLYLKTKERQHSFLYSQILRVRLEGVAEDE